MSLKLGCAAALAALAFAFPAEADSLDRANAIAQKFSEASEAKPAATPATPGPAKPAGQVTDAVPPLRKAATPPSPPAVKATPAATVKTAESAPPRPDLDYEMDMLRRARLEEAERRSTSTTGAAPAPANKPPALIPVDAKVEPASRVPAKAEGSDLPSPKPQVVAPAPAPVVAPAPLPPPVAKVMETPSPTAPPVIATVPTPSGPRATILLALDTTPASSGVKVVPDPIICIDQVCYVTGGFKKAAIAMPRGDALALKGTEGKLEDTCRGQFGCIYREVVIPADAIISVVDLGTGSSSDAGSFSIVADATCKATEGELMCNNGLVTHAYRVWSVPEATAQSVGAQLLEDAIADGLVGGDIASTGDK